MNAPWYQPSQILVALGITLPFFLYYGYRIYGLVLDHRAALRRFSKSEGSAKLVREARLAAAEGELAAQLAMAEVFTALDHELGTRRRALRSDAHAVVLVGFVGTLIGVSSAFASLASSGSDEGREASAIVEQLIGGGLATALVSSLVAALLGVLSLGYLSATEHAVVTVRRRVLAACRADLPSFDAGDSGARAPESGDAEETEAFQGSDGDSEAPSQEESDHVVTIR